MSQEAKPLRILIESVPHQDQRYDTCGDWVIEEDGTWHIRVSELPMKNALFPQKFGFLVAFHELVEMALCQAAGVTAAEVDSFDMAYAGSYQEPGDDIDAPYYRMHQMATALERTMAAQLDVDWGEYERAINTLGETDAE